MSIFSFLSVDSSSVFLTLGFTIFYNSTKIFNILLSFSVCISLFNISSASSIKLLYFPYFSLNSCLFIFLLSVSFSKVSALSSMISSPSTLVSSFLALVIVFSISLNLFSLTFIHFGNFVSFNSLFISSDFNSLLIL